MPIEWIVRRAQGREAPVLIACALCFWLCAPGQGSQQPCITDHPRPCSAACAFERLVQGTAVDMAVRLIAYDPESQPNLAARRLQSLGAPKERFVFVADYMELRGYTVKEALAKIGRPLREGEHVSMVRFSAHGRTLFPANARGVLHALQEIERQNSALHPYRSAHLERFLKPDEVQGLGELPAGDWSWRSISRHFHRDSQIVRTLVREKSTAFHWIGSIDEDWNSLGYAEMEAGTDLPRFDFSLRVGEQTVEVPNFGARVFLTVNEEISEIQDVELIDFWTPALSHVP